MTTTSAAGTRPTKTRVRWRPDALLLGMLLLAVAAWMSPLPAARAQELPPGIEEAGPAGRVVEVIDGDTLVLDDGREVRMTGTQAPKLPLGRRGFAAWPLAEEAKAALEALALGERVRLAFDDDGARGDRHGRVLAQIVRDDGLWLQGAMVLEGWARVYGFADNRAPLPALLALERQARDSRRGIWDHPAYAVATPEGTERLIDRFALVEGRVLEAALVRGRAFLNFGRDWKTDFTVTLAPPVARLFEREGIDPRDYEGRRVRVRGWVGEFNGPEIEVTHPEQIEVLE